MIFVFEYKFWLYVIFLFFFLMWLFYGNENYEFVGLKPLSGTWKQTDPDMAQKVKSVYDTIGIDPVNVDFSKIPEKTKPVNQETQEPEPEEPEPDPLLEGEPVKVSGYKQMSHGQRIVQKCLETWFKVPFRSIRPNFLKNPETKQNLELDCFNADFRLAAEYNGIQHYEYPNKYNKSKEEFLRGIQRDHYKREKCDENGVHLIVVPHFIKNDEIPRYVKNKLPVHLRALADPNVIDIN